MMDVCNTRLILGKISDYFIFHDHILKSDIFPMNYKRHLFKFPVLNNLNPTHRKGSGECSPALNNAFFKITGLFTKNLETFQLLL